MAVWYNKIDSQVSLTYVNPLFPKKNEEIEIKIKITNNVNQVFLFFRSNGDFHKIECEIKDKYAIAKTKIQEEEFCSYYFVLNVDNDYFYYSLLGVTHYIPSSRDWFVIRSNISPASWVAGSTCYQILPDRFRNGNPSLDLVDGEYEFDGAQVKKLSFEDKPLSFEEGKCLDFYCGDFQGIIDSIDYLKDFGVNCLFLNPIGKSNTTHRYDCTDFFHIDDKLGGDDKFIELIDILHKKGIKIIVDISINHTGINHPWFVKAKSEKNSKEASYYYIDKKGNISFWENVSTLPQLNYSSQELRNIMYRNSNSIMRRFIKPPFNQDGWRLDVADDVGRRGKDQYNDEIWREVNQKLKADNPNAYIVGESWTDASSHLQGDQWDATMNYIGSSKLIRRWFGENERSLANDWGHDPGYTRPYSGLDLGNHLDSQLKSMLGQMIYFQMNLIDSHDTPRLYNNDKVMDFDIYEGCVMLLYLLPGMPNIYYGDEIGLYGEMGSVEMSRYPMQWDKNKWNKDFYYLYKKIGKVRQDYLRILQFESYKILSSGETYFTFARYSKDEALILIMNKAKYEKRIEIKIDFLEFREVSSIYNKCNIFFEKENIIVHLAEKKSVLLYIK